MHVAYNFPERQYKEIFPIVQDILVKNGIELENEQQWPHISIISLPALSEEQQSDIKRKLTKKPQFQIQGWEILPGGFTQYDYLTLILDIPEEMKNAYDTLKSEYNVTTKFPLKPHSSIVRFPKKYTKQVEAALPEIEEQTKNFMYTPLKPNQIQFWTQVGDKFEIAAVTEKKSFIQKFIDENFDENWVPEVLVEKKKKKRKKKGAQYALAPFYGRGDGTSGATMPPFRAPTNGPTPKLGPSLPGPTGINAPQFGTLAASKGKKANIIEMVAYHGTNQTFTKFNPSMKTRNATVYGRGSYFTSSPKVASDYAGDDEGANVHIVDLDMDSGLGFWDVSNYKDYKHIAEMLGYEPWPNDKQRNWFAVLEKQMREDPKLDGIFSPEEGYSDYLASKLKSLLYSGVKIPKNMTTGAEPSEYYVVYNPKVIKHKFAEMVVEGKQVGNLYQFIDPDKFVSIVKSNKMVPHGGWLPKGTKLPKELLHYTVDGNILGRHVFWGVSTTRNANWKPNTREAKIPYWAPIRITLDGDKLSNNHKIIPYNDFWIIGGGKSKNGFDPFYSQAEEVILTDKNGLVDWKKYVVAIDALESAKDQIGDVGMEINFVDSFSKKVESKSFINSFIEENFDSEWGNELEDFGLENVNESSNGHFLDSYLTAKQWAEENVPDSFDAEDHYLEGIIYPRIREYVDFFNSTKSKGEITLYRAIVLKSDMSNLNLKNIGSHWAFEKSGAGSYGLNRDKKKDESEFIFTGIAKTKDIDWEYGFESYLYYGEEQKECALEPGTKVTLTHVDDKKMQKPLIGVVGTKLMGEAGEELEEVTAYHGTRRDFGKLKPNQDGIIWLTSDKNIGKRYQHYYDKGTPKIIEVEIDDEAIFLDFTDVNNPTVQKYKEQYEIDQIGMHGAGWKISESSWKSNYATYATLERLGIDIAKEDGVDVITVLDNEGAHNHKSFAVINPSVIKSQKNSTGSMEESLKIQENKSVIGYRGVSAAGLREMRPSESGVYGAGIYWYDYPLGARSYAGIGGGVIVARLLKWKKHGHNIYTTAQAEDSEILGVIPTENTLNANEYLDHVHSLMMGRSNKGLEDFGLEESLNIKPIKWSYPSEKELEDEFHEADIDALLLPAGYPKPGEREEAFEFFKDNLKEMEIDPKTLEDENAWRFRHKDYKSFRDLVKSYGGPKDPDSMVRKIQAGGELPMPVVILKADGALRLAGGATRVSIASLAGQKVRALVIDEKKALERRILQKKKSIANYISKSKNPDIKELNDKIMKASASLSPEELKHWEYEEGDKDLGFDAHHLSMLWEQIRNYEHKIAGEGK
jgi:hypothetical protein